MDEPPMVPFVRRPPSPRLTFLRLLGLLLKLVEPHHQSLLLLLHLLLLSLDGLPLLLLVLQLGPADKTPRSEPTKR